MQAIHSKQKEQFTCVHCNRSFSRMDALIRHLKIDSGEAACCGLKERSSHQQKAGGSSGSSSVKLAFDAKIDGTPSQLNVENLSQHSSSPHTTGDARAGNRGALDSPVGMNASLDGKDSVGMGLLQDLPDFYKLPKQPSLDDTDLLNMAFSYPSSFSHFYPSLDHQTIPAALNESFQLYDDIIRKKSVVDAALPLDISTSNHDTSGRGRSPGIGLPEVASAAEQASENNVGRSSTNHGASSATQRSSAPSGKLVTNRTTTTETSPTLQASVATMTPSANDPVTSSTTLASLISRNKYLSSRVSELERECAASQTRLKSCEARVTQLEFEKSMLLHSSSSNAGSAGAGGASGGGNGSAAAGMFRSFPRKGSGEMLGSGILGSELDRRNLPMLDFR
ncbi:MAG: hypothetical protein SGCHY_003675 [Lobulomycetales sp.]